MRPSDGGPSEAQIVASLEALDATLAGDPVDPAHADLAELALLLAAERPLIEDAFAARLDRAVQRRFAPVVNRPDNRPAKIIPALRRRWWFWTPAAGLAVALIAAVVIVAAGGPSHRPSAVAASAGAKLPSASASAAGRPARTAGGGAASGGDASAAASSGAASSGAASSGAESTRAPIATAPQPASPNAAAGAAGGTLALQTGTGRKTIRASQLGLTTSPRRLEAVAQEVFAVVGQVQGVVNNSTVTATSGPGGYAQFQLSIPSATLPEAMASLSTLRYARVTSRTDTTQDVNGEYQADVRALADARARRTSLLKQLGKATTQTQIDSLTARIHDAEASIASDQATLRGLSHQINYSHVNLTINGGMVPLPVARGHSGFGVGQAAHDAGRVLTVAAGLALIAAAALAPLAVLGALAWWMGRAVRRRRREQALDLV